MTRSRLLHGSRPLLAFLMAAALAGCSTGTGPAPSGGAQSGAAAGGSCPTSAPPHAVAGTSATATIGTPKGSIVVKLEADLGPAAVGNFVALARCGYYNGVVFHRLVPGFVIQGGDGKFGKTPNVDARVGGGGPGYTIDDDPVTSPYARGVVAMARTPAPHSEGSQFFIVLSDAAAASLASANTYAIMGHVTSGMDVVDAIAAMPNKGDAENNAAVDPVPMTSVSITTP